MSARIVTEEVRFTWDHASQRLPRGQVIDVPPGSALEAAIGTEKLIPLFGAPPAVPEAPQAPARKSAAKDSSDKRGGQS